MRMTATLIPLLFLTVNAFSQDVKPEGPGVRLTFDDSAAKYVLENPARALQDERDSIWNAFEGYRITLVWHEASSFPVTWDVWERGLNRFLKDTSLTRRTLELVGSLESKTRREQYAIAQHISSYLGSEKAIEASVYFVAFTTPYAFCVERNKIGIDITGEEWSFDTDCVMNTVIHEIYHVGYRANTPDLEHLEADPIDRETFIRFCYAYLESEGMATYVAYRALDLYPSDYRHEDYRLLEDTVHVKKAIGQIAGLVKGAKTAAIDSLKKAVWDVGVTERAFYVAGAYMAMAIEKEHGTEYLAELVRKGSLCFVKEYNSLVPADYRMALIEF